MNTFKYVYFIICQIINIDTLFCFGGLKCVAARVAKVDTEVETGSFVNWSLQK